MKMFDNGFTNVKYMCKERINVTYLVWQHCWSLFEIETFSVYLSDFHPLHTQLKSLTVKTGHENIS